MTTETMTLTRETWYLLFNGRSASAAGTTEFVARTTHRERARAHLAQCRREAHNIGYVAMVTDRTYRTAYSVESLQ